MEIISWNITIKQIFWDFFEEFKQSSPHLLNKNIEENVQKMLSCRDPDKIGFTMYQCPNHPEHMIRMPHSCKSRFCNTCWKIQTDEWIASCHQLLPNIEYKHLTLTIPEELRIIFWNNREFLSCLFEAAKQMLLSFFKEKKMIPAISIVRHTFWRRLNWNPHLHIIVSCGWLMEDWTWKDQDFIPYKMLSKRWRYKLLTSIEWRMAEVMKSTVDKTKGQVDELISFHNNTLRKLYKKNWYTHLSHERIDMVHTVSYIWRYSRRPVISEAKILWYSKENKTVTFEYQDHRDTTPTRRTLSVFKFIELLIQHIPERYNHQIRHYWLVANRVSSFFKKILEKLFWKAQKFLSNLSWRIRQFKFSGKDPLICPHCLSELVCTWMAIFSKKHNKIIFI